MWSQHSGASNASPGENVTDHEERLHQIEKAWADLDCAQTDDKQHVVVVTMNSGTETMAIHTVNTPPALAQQLLQIALMHTTDTSPEQQRSLH